MPQIAIRLSDAELAALDQLIAARNFGSRAAAMRDALAHALKAEEDRQIAKAYERAYGNRPPTQEEIDMGEIGAYLLGELTKDEPPWDFGDEDEDAEPKHAVADRAQTFSEVEASLQQVLDLVRAAAAQERAAS